HTTLFRSPLHEPMRGVEAFIPAGDDGEPDIDGLLARMRLDPNHALPVAVGADCRTTHYACRCVMEQLERAEAEVERLRAQAAAFRSLLEAWRDEFYFENFEGKYRECKVCGADDTLDHDEGCIVQRDRKSVV